MSIGPHWWNKMHLFIQISYILYKLGNTVSRKYLQLINHYSILIASTRISFVWKYICITVESGVAMGKMGSLLNFTLLFMPIIDDAQYLCLLSADHFQSFISE